MATRTAIAAKERKSREDIAAKDRYEKKREFEKSHALEKKMLPYKQMESASKTTSNIMKGAKDLSSVMASSGNDPKWYKNFDLSKFATNLPTYYRLGSELAPEWLSDGYADAVTGIATILYMPTLPNQVPNNVAGSTAYQYSPINQSLTRFMAELRKLNSRIGDYDPSDIGLYWFAIVGLIAILGKITKALKAYNTYYATNRYLSKMFIKSCGFDPDDFIYNVQQYKAALKRWISIFNANAVIPNVLDFIKRQYWLATVVVREHATDCAQLYHFVTPFDIHLNDDETYVSFSKTSSDDTFAVLKTRIDTNIQRLFNSVGVVTMTADLRSAFPDKTLLKFPEFNGDETLTYSDSIHDLEQIHNLRSLPGTDGDMDFGETTNSVMNSKVLSKITRPNIIVDSDGFLAQGALSSGNLLPLTYTGSEGDNVARMGTYVNVDNNFLNFYDSDYISDDAILEATRLRCLLHQYNSTWGGNALAVNGTEIVLSIMLLTVDVTSDGCYIDEVVTDYDMNALMSLSVLQWCRALSYTSYFDWFPWIRFYGSDDTDVLYTYGEIDHAVYLSNNNLKILHEACAFSLFYVDDFASGHVA